MAPKELTRFQLSSRISYNQQTPSFLRKLQNRVAGVPDVDDDSQDEFENDGSGRPPIPKRPSIPHRPSDDPGSADEEEGEEKPQVVVLKEGKHLTEKEAENERRKQRGRPPLPDAADSLVEQPEPTTQKKEAVKPGKKNLSFSSSKSGVKASTGKRRAVGDADGGQSDTESKTTAKKKAKKASKTLLSFGDDA